MLFPRIEHSLTHSFCVFILLVSFFCDSLVCILFELFDLSLLWYLKYFLDCKINQFLMHTGMQEECYGSLKVELNVALFSEKME